MEMEHAVLGAALVISLVAMKITPRKVLIGFFPKECFTVERGR